MKIVFNIICFIAAATLCSHVSAQQKPLKMAHINTQELMTSMPEYDSATVKMQKLQKQLELDLEALQTELGKKFEEYAQNSKNWTDLVRSSHERDIQTMQQNVEVARQSAQEEFGRKQEEFFQPVREKALKTISEVAQAENITYVMEAQGLLYHASDSKDILPLVREKLGINSK
jgi:outer membrane protein